MFPKKIIFFGMLLIGGVFYFLKGRSVHELQSKQNRPTSYKRREKEMKQREEHEKKTAAGNKYIAGECLTNSKDAWEYTKILDVGASKYKIIDCHKYKGCTKEKRIDFNRIEFEYRKGRKIKCP